MGDEYDEDFAELKSARQQSENEKVDLLQQKIIELSRELNSEKVSHEKTRITLQAAKDDSMTISLDSSSLNRAAGASMELKAEFFKFCTKHSIPMSTFEAKQLTDSDCIAILKNASKLIKTLQSGNHPSEGTGEVSAGASDPASRIRALENELRLALGAAEDIRALKSKVIQMIEKTRSEKEAKLRAEAELRSTRKKMEILGDHMEKLMTNLRHEATAKIRTIEALRVSEKNVEKWKDQCDGQYKRNLAKERLIAELREGSKILEDQLRLMDEKYLELRIKLDWTREHGMKKLKQAEKTASALRMKYVMSHGGSLDQVSLPEISMGSVGSSDASFSSFGAKGSSSGIRRSSTLKSARSAEGSLGSEPTIDLVQEKLRKRQGIKQEWTEEKARNLVINTR